MTKFFTIPACAGLTMVLAACGGGGGGPATVTPTTTSTISQLGTDRQAASVVTATRTATGAVQFTFTDGPLRDMVAICADHAGAACVIVGGPDGTAAQGTLEGRMAGQHAYAGSLRIAHGQGGTLQNSVHRLYQAIPDATPNAAIALPSGVGTYTGEFMAGAGIGAQSGIAEGRIDLIVNFDSARVSGVMNGSLRDTQTPLRASFNNVTIDGGTGQFASDANSTFLFNDAFAGGTVRGGVYGPDAQETAGVFEMGNTAGDGMSGVFLGCAGAVASCVTHAAPTKP